MLATIPSSLKDRQHPLINRLANYIEGYWELSLSLSPYEIPSDLGYIEGSLSGEKLIIENRCYQTPQFRKLHLELAKVGDKLDILHCVMFPRLNFNLPIFGVDLVGNPGGISAAIVDLSPVNRRLTLPESYNLVLSKLPEIDFACPRDIPEWGDIFSEFCLFVRPKNRSEEILFLDRVTSFLGLHCHNAIASSPVYSPKEKNEIRRGQRYYCDRQQQNDKTRRVLEKSLGKDWTERYMRKMLFDC